MTASTFTNALAIPCHPHHAPAGAFCWDIVNSVCGARVAAASDGKEYVPAKPEAPTLRGPQLSRDALEVRIAQARSHERTRAQVRAATASRSRR